MQHDVLCFSTVPTNNLTPRNMKYFLDTLYSKCTKGFIEIREIASQGKVNREWIPVTERDISPFPDDANVYFGVATRIQGKGDKGSIEEIPAVWVDIDLKTATDRDKVDNLIANFPLKPTIVVNSGHGCHIYFGLNKPAVLTDVFKIEDINRRLADHFEADQACAEAARILRMPDTYNVKKIPHMLVTVEQIDQNAFYNLSDFDFLPPAVAKRQSPVNAAQNWYTGLLAGVYEGSRTQTAVRLVGRYVRNRLEKNEIQLLLSKWNEKNIPQLTPSELERTVSDAYDRYSKADNLPEAESAESEQEYTSVIESSVIGFPAFLRKQIPPRPDIITPLLKQGEIIMIAASRGVGKTWLALSLAFLATRKTELGNWKTANPTSALYADGEMAEEDMQNRILELKLGHQQEDAPLYLLSSAAMRSADKPTPKLNNPTWRKSISNYLKSHEDIKVVIFDNMACLTPGRDENQKKDWDGINEWLLELRAKGIAVILLHHVGKNGEQRGTSAIEDNINISIKLTQPIGYKGEDGAKFKVEFTKARRLYGDDAKSFTLHLQTENGVFDWKVIEDSQDDSEKQIIELDKQGMKQKDIAKQVGKSPSWICQVLTKYKDAEIARRFKALKEATTDKTETENTSDAEELEIVDSEDQAENCSSAEEPEVN